MSDAILDLAGFLHGWAAGIHARHGVDPYLYLALTTVCAPPFYYSIYRLTKALATRQGQQLSVWSAVFLGATALPYLYVLLFGRNLPWWSYLILGVLLAHGVVSLGRRLRQRTPARGQARSWMPGGSPRRHRLRAGSARSDRSHRRGHQRAEHLDIDVAQTIDVQA